MQPKSQLKPNDLIFEDRSNSLIKKCCICDTRTDLRSHSEQVRVQCNVRQFHHNFFAVWRCPHCRSLHCLEEIDFAEYYANYPIRRQKYDFFAKKIFKKRFKILLKAGFKNNDTLLDYGCGSGYFVHYARSLGISAEGYDPYSSEKFSDISVLSKKYDFVISQDVIEHDENPNTFIKKIKQYVKPGGTLVLGTPNADKIDLLDPLAPLDSIHAPYHRHIYSLGQLQQVVADKNWKITLTSEESYFDTWFPFVNSAFLVRLFRSGEGVMDFGFDSISYVHFLRNPALIFWGLLGNFFRRGQDMVVAAQLESE